MKRILSMVMLLTVSMCIGSVSAQSHEGRYFGWGDRARYYFQPQLRGDISQIVVTHIDGTIFIKEYHTFNEHGDVVSTKGYNSSNKLVNNSNYTYDYAKGTVYEAHYFLGELTFDNETTLTTATISDDELFGTSNEYKAEYKYDSKGRVIEKKSDDRTTTYEYDGAGNITKIVTELKDGTKSTQLKKYDTRGNVVELHISPSTYSDSSRTTYQISYRK